MTTSIIAAAFLAIGNGADGVKIAQYPVTNGEYAQFVDATGHQPPRYWKDGMFPKGKERHPVLWVSYRDAEAYCAWLGKKDAAHSYRLPTDAEWETAAGETPRDAEFNFNGVVASHFLKADPSRMVEYVHPKSIRKGDKEKLSEVISLSSNGSVRGWVNHRDYTGFIYTDLFKEISDAGGWTTPVDAYPQTKAACGALDMWGNCWEWTSTEIVAENGAERGKKVNAIKGGSWYATRRSCTTEFKGEGRRPDGHYNTVGFRVVQCDRNKKAKNTTTGENMTTTWDKTFPKSDKVEHSKATFRNRFGITLAADVYKPKGAAGKLAAIAVSGPFGAVKEQCSGLYAQTLAERGFLTIAFDPSFTGESGGEPRYVASPDINTEDFQAAVDYLISRGDVDADKIGILGICGWGGLAINAAAVDTRVKATVASTMYDMTRVTANGYNDGEDSAAARKAKKEAMNAQRIADFKSGVPALGGGVVDPLPADAPQFVKDYHAYYKTPRGYHKRSLNSNGGWNKTSFLSFINAKLLAYAGEIESAVMVLHGEKAHSRYFGETAFKMLKGDNKELVIVPGASHCDLYDGGGKNAIPFDRIESFYKKNLK